MTRIWCRRGVIPTRALARRRLHDLAGQRVGVAGDAGANAGVKVPALVAGADSIDDMELLRHGGMGKVFAGLRAPSTLGTHLRGYTHGHVRQLDAVHAGLLVGLAGIVPNLLAGGDEVAFSILTTPCAPPMGT